jgi:hypothetical protein
MAFAMRGGRFEEGGLMGLNEREEINGRPDSPLHISLFILRRYSINIPTVAWIISKEAEISMPARLADAYCGSSHYYLDLLKPEIWREESGDERGGVARCDSRIHFSALMMALRQQLTLINC